MSKWCWANRCSNSRCSRNCWHRKISDKDRRRYDYIWFVAVFLELRSFKYLHPPKAHEKLANGNKDQGYNKKVKPNKRDYHKFYFLHAWGGNTTLSRFGRGKARSWFLLKDDAKWKRQSECNTRWHWNFWDKVNMPAVWKGF